MTYFLRVVNPGDGFHVLATDPDTGRRYLHETAWQSVAVAEWLMSTFRLAEGGLPCLEGANGWRELATTGDGPEI